MCKHYVNGRAGLNRCILITVCKKCLLLFIVLTFYIFLFMLKELYTTIQSVLVTITYIDKQTNAPIYPLPYAGTRELAEKFARKYVNKGACLAGEKVFVGLVERSINSTAGDEHTFDTAEPWGLFFQDNATPQMEALEELHNNIMFYLAVIMFAVTWIFVSIILNYRKSKISNKYINHGTLVELVWTVTPALILILIAFPSFKLLYLMDEVIDPSLVIYGEGHQWYWSYQYPDFTNNDEEYVEYDSYIIPESDLEVGKLRMLEVDNRVIIPELTHTRFVVAGADVIHSYACPSLGVKCDAYPGRLNQSSVYLNREGTYFGQCSEICGILHSSMPISIQSVSLGKFLFWLYDQIGA